MVRVRKPGYVVVDVMDCPRCGQDHENVMFHALRAPDGSQERQGEDFVWFASCTVSSQPFMVGLGQEGDATYVERSSAERRSERGGPG